MDKVNIAIAAWFIVGLSIFAVGTVIPTDCTPAYSVELVTVEGEPTDNVTKYADLPRDGQKVFKAVQNGTKTTIDLHIYDRYFDGMVIQHSDTYYQIERGGSLDCGTPLGTFLQYLGVIISSVFILIYSARRIYVKVI